MKTLTLRTLGECAIQVGDTTVTPNAPHLFAVLLYLGIERCREIPRAALIEVLFSDESSSAATHNLRQLLYRVRKLGLELGSTVSTVRIDGSAVVDLVHQRLGRPYHESAKDPGASCELLPGYQPPTEPFSRWLECYRDGVHRSFVRKLSEELQTARRGANWSTVEAFASKLLALDPFNETATLCLAESLARSGSKQRAVSMLQRFEEEVGSPTSGLALPSRLLKRRISESTLDEKGESWEAPLVGRTREMEFLADVWARTRAGRCTVVALTGEKSLGKSRLVSEFLSIVRLDNSGSTVFSRRRASDKDRPLSLFADICKQLVGMPGAAGCAPAGLAFISRLTMAPNEFNSPRAGQAEMMFAIGNLRRAIIELAECVSHERPLIVAIDDSRFLDSASRTILCDIQHELPESRLLILAAGESDDDIRADVHSLRLQPLDNSSLTLVAEHVVARRQWPLHDDLRNWCIEMASGNPGYLELLLQSARLTRTRQLPRDLIALIEERIVALSPNAQRALQAIALFGAACDGDVVERLSGLDDSILLDALEELENASLVGSGQDGIACRSALIEECTRSVTPTSVACVLHARSAKYLEFQAGTTVATQAVAWRIAAHWLNGGNLQRARHWQRVCWQQSIAIGQPRTAVAAIQDAMRDCRGVIDRAALLDDLACALFAAGDLLGVEAALRERHELSRILNEGSEVLERICFDQIETAVMIQEDPSPLKPRLRELVHSDRLDIHRRIRAARTLMITADYELDRGLAEEVYRANKGLSPRDTRSALLHGQTRLIFQSVFGDHAEAASEINDLFKLVALGGPSWEALTTRGNLAFAQELVLPELFDLGDLEAAFRESRDAEMYQLAISLAGRAGCCWIDRGQIERATEIQLEAKSLFGRPGTDRLCLNYLACSIDLAIIDGDFDQARLHIESLRTNAPGYATGQVRNYWKMHHLRCELLSSARPIAHEDLDWIVRRHVQVRSFGRHDDFVELLWLALNSRGQQEAASRALGEYLTCWRRERRPCGHLLKMRTASDPAWDTIRRLPDGRYTRIETFA